MSDENTEAALQTLLDRAAITDVVLRFARSFDIQDWSMMRAALSDTIEVDYSDFRGEPVKTVSADAYVASRRSALSHLKTQHLLSGHLVVSSGDTAECTCNMVIYRYLPGTTADNTFDTHGYYVFRLRREADHWRISHIVQKVYWSSGNPGIHGAHQQRRD